MEVQITGDKKKKYCLIGDYTYFSKRYNKIINVHSGFCWDADSCSPDIYPFEASLVHDFIYETKILTRWQADMIYRDILIEQGYHIRANLRWIALRVVGWYFWKKQ